MYRTTYWGCDFPMARIRLGLIADEVFGCCFKIDHQSDHQIWRWRYLATCCFCDKNLLRNKLATVSRALHSSYRWVKRALDVIWELLVTVECAIWRCKACWVNGMVPNICWIFKNDHRNDPQIWRQRYLVTCSFLRSRSCTNVITNVRPSDPVNSLDLCSKCPTTVVFIHTRLLCGFCFCLLQRMSTLLPAWERNVYLHISTIPETNIFHLIRPHLPYILRILTHSPHSTA